MTTDRARPEAKANSDRRAEREAKLAEALRANLRRRKAEARGRAAKPAPPEGGDSA